MLLNTEGALICVTRRMNTYKLLSECYYLPDEGLREKLNKAHILTDERFSKFIKDISMEDKLDSLKVDFSSLFVGPFKLLAPPYGSLYLEDSGTIMGDSTINVKEWYKKEGLKIKLSEAPDHIAIELEFIYFLISKQIEAVNNSKSDIADEYLTKQSSFLSMHPGSWIAEFTDKIIENTDTAFYKTLARATRLFIKEDLKALGTA